MLKKFRTPFTNKKLAKTIRAHADRLRDSRIWIGAAQLYKSYLDLRPQDAAIWVQLAHCQKESGLLDEADVSYGRAATMTPEVADIWLQIGHLRKVQGRISEATASYAKALTKDPVLMAARLELEQLKNKPSDIACPNAAPVSHAAVKQFARLDERMEEFGTRFDTVEERFAVQSRHIERLLELMSTVKALGFAMKRQERRVDFVTSRLEELEEGISTQSHNIEHLLELNSTVEALASGLARPEVRAADGAGRLLATENKIDRPDGRLTDVPEPAKVTAGGLTRTDAISETFEARRASDCEADAAALNNATLPESLNSASAVARGTKRNGGTVPDTEWMTRSDVSGARKKSRHKPIPMKKIDG
jgi:uncharacterized coiled-coil protein SlyX